MRNTPGPCCTDHPLDDKAAANDDASPEYMTRMTETPPKARLEVEAELTPGIARTADNPDCTVAALGVAH